MSISNNVLVVTDSSNTGATFCDQAISTTVGQEYVIEVTATGTSGTGIGLYVTGYSGPVLGYMWEPTYSFKATAGSTTIRLYRYEGHTGSGTISSIIIKEASPDRSVANSYGLATYGTVTKTAVATGAELVAYSGFSSSNYLKQPYNSDLDFGTGDFSYSFWHSCTFTTPDRIWMSHGEYTTTGSGLSILQHNSGGPGDRVYFYIGEASGNVTVDGIEALGYQNWVVTRRSGIVYVYRNGKLEGSVANTNDINLSSETINELYIGGGYTGSSVFYYGAGPLALFRVSATATSAEQSVKIYNDEKYLFQENAKATLYGSSDAVTALGYDEDTELLHVGTSAGRSEFQGLNRVNNTTDAVGTAISASNGLVAED